MREFCSFLPGEPAALVTQPFSIPVPGSLWLGENPGAGLMSPPALASLSLPELPRVHSFDLSSPSLLLAPAPLAAPGMMTFKRLWND